MRRDFFGNLEQFDLRNLRQLRHLPLELLRTPVAYDLVEIDNQYEYRVELPGFEKENIAINLEEDMLAIKATHKASEDKYLVKERNYLSLSRTFNLPEDADKDSVNASYEQGILKVRLGKLAPVAPARKTVDIS